MNGLGFIGSIIVGCVSGYLAGRLMRGGGFGCLVNLLLGIVGGIVGGWLFGLLGISSNGGVIGGLVTSVVGAVLILWIASKFKK
jgi:uncharacterized membrane protein YeaQ/YmgE (transglycosylase-associated protein family)